MRGNVAAGDAGERGAVNYFEHAIFPMNCARYGDLNFVTDLAQQFSPLAFLDDIGSSLVVLGSAAEQTNRSNGRSNVRLISDCGIILALR